MISYLDKEHKNLLLFIAVVALIRLVVASNVGLGVDEAHYVLYGTHLDWSYFDHPPLVGWLSRLSTLIFGLNELGARIPAVLIGVFVSFFIYDLVLKISKDHQAAFIAVLALSGSFLFNALFLMLIPETILLLLVFPIIFTTIKLEQHNTLTTWLMLGVLLGVAGLTEYTAILFIVAILLYFIIKKRWDIILSPKALPAITTAFVLILPVLYWNIEHHWISFTYQSDHVVVAKHINLNGFFQSLLVQFGAYNPLLFPIAFYGLYKALRSKDSYLFLSALFGSVIILFFTYASLYKTALPHWSALFYLLFIPIGSYFLFQRAKGYQRYLKTGIAFGLILSAVVYIELAAKIIPFPDYKSPLRDLYGFPTIMKQANMLVKDTNKDAIAVTNWTIASRAMFYNLPYSSTVYLLGNGTTQFSFWQKGSPIGKNIIVINTHFFHKNVTSNLKCTKVIKHKRFYLKTAGHTVNSVQLVTCQNYQGFK